MHTHILSVILFLGTIFTIVEVRPLSKFEQNLFRHRRQEQTNLLSDQETSTIANEPAIDHIWHDILPVFTDHLNSHLTDSPKTGCNRTINADGDTVEYCIEKVLNSDGTYSTKTNSTLYKQDGTIVPLHEASSDIQIETA